MRLSTEGREKLNTLLETAAAHAARHYSAELQERYESNVFDAAEELVDQVRGDRDRDYDEAKEGSRVPVAYYTEDEHLMDEYDNEAPF